MPLRDISLVRWTIDARRYGEWLRDVTDKAARTSIELLLTPPEAETLG